MSDDIVHLCEKCGSDTWELDGNTATCTECGYKVGVFNIEEIVEWLCTRTTAESTDDSK
jgi:DNA-directed RNA polymerase subunit RPC12/RpoP